MARAVKTMVSIILVNYNGKEQTLACLQSLAAVRVAVPYEVILVDNHSSDDSVAAVGRAFPDVRVLPQDSNRGFGCANTIGAATAAGDYLFFVNNDTLFTRDIVTPLRDFLAAHPQAGAAGPMLLNPDGTFQLSYGKYPSLLNELRTKRDTAIMKQIPEDRVPRVVDWISFAAVMIPRSVFERIDGFDERFFMYFEDVDMCHRMNDAGYRTFYCADFSLIHVGGASWTVTRRAPIRREYRRSQILYYTLHRSSLELFALRCYLSMKFILVFLLGRGDRRHAAASMLSLVWTFHAHRS